VDHVEREALAFQWALQNENNELNDQPAALQIQKRF
jgi:hypothetical protein